MFPKFSFLLIFAVVLSLTHKSLCQNWETFQKKHLTNILDINCDVEMAKALFNCKEMNTFIYALPGRVQALCKNIKDNTEVLSTDTFYLPECNRIKLPCHYKLKKPLEKICITCVNELPIHFAGVGSCP
uniref:Onconase-type RNase A ribonuclease 3 n=1 Tax=Aquarana catesbeiana TaxID=8400 RepID=Q6EUW7_AQUCT|nr:onconase-type RNase A ribonuclease 3 precursor [Aquarana catesbeiana]